MQQTIWGWDTANTEWVKVLVDNLGHLQVDVVAAGATVGHCYGYLAPNWYELLVESAANPNLRTSLYHGVNQIVSVATGADIGDASRGLLTQAGIRGWDGAFWKSVNVEDGAGDALDNARASLATVSKLYGYNGATWDRLRVMTPVDAFVTPTMALQVSSFLMGYDGGDWNMVRVDAAGHLQIDVLSSALPALAATAANQVLINANLATLVTEQGRCYGYDGTNWQTLLVESNVLHNLRVKLYDGANGIDSDQLDSTIVPSGDRGILTRSQVCGYNLEPFHQRRSDADALAPVARELCQMNIALLYGYNGSTFDRLRTESSTAFNLRVRLYAGANALTDGLLSVDTLARANERGLVVRNQAYLAYAAGNSAIMLASEIIPDGSTGRYMPGAALYGYNGATWDRLRTYGTGILKVGRAEVGLLDVRMVGTGQVGAVGARRLYWMLLNPSAGNSVVELTDATIALQPIKADHFDTSRDGHMITFDPPLEFSNGIYLETFTNMTSITFGYL